MTQNKIAKSTYIKLSLKFRGTSKRTIYKYFTTRDFFNIGFGAFMFLFTCVFNGNSLNYLNIAKFNLFTVATTLLTLINREDAFDINGEKRSLFCLVPLSKKTIRQLDLKIELLAFIKNIVVFQLFFIVYGSVEFGLLFFIISLFDIFALSMFAYFINAILKIVIILIGNRFTIFYTIEKYISVIIFTGMFYVVNHFGSKIISFRYLFTNTITKISNFSPIYSVNIKYAIITVSITLIFTLLNYYIFTNFRFVKHSKKPCYDKTFIPTLKDSYEEDSINGIINSLIVNDRTVKTAYIENTLHVFVNMGWKIITLTLLNFYSSIEKIIVIASFITLYECGQRILTFLYSTSPNILNYFKIFPAYTDDNISKKITLKILKNSSYLIFLPTTILIIIFTCNNLLTMILCVLTGTFIFLGSIGINYMVLKKNKPFAYTKISDKEPKLDFINFFYVMFSFYLFIGFAFLDLSALTLAPLLIVFFVPSVLCVINLLRRIDNNMYPFTKQKSNSTSSIACIEMFSSYYQKENHHEWNITKDINKTNESSFSDIYCMAEDIGLNLIDYQINSVSCIIGKEQNHPYIAKLKIKNNTRYIVVYETQEKALIVGDPSKKSLSTISMIRFQKYFSGNVLIKNNELI